MAQILATQRVPASQLSFYGSAVKLADESVTSSTTLQNDNALVLPLAANASYTFRCWLGYEGGTQGSSDIKWTWSVPAGATLRYSAAYTDTTGARIQDFAAHTASDTVNAGTHGSGNPRYVVMEGTLDVDTTPGNLQLRWAQNTSNTTATVVHAQSTIELWQQ